MNGRILKFRAWNKKTKKFVYCKLEQDYIMLPEMHMAELENWQQYTGLKDKHGKEIYEGDVLKYKPAKRTKQLKLKQHLWLIVWDDKKLRMRGESLNAPQETYMSLWTMNRYEIIGNIMENPELLKRGAGHE